MIFYMVNGDHRIYCKNHKPLGSFKVEQNAGNCWACIREGQRRAHDD